MTSQADFLVAIADRLEAAGIDYMVVGSLAASFHGEPRTTVDIDIVIDPSEEALRRFVDSLPRADYYVDEIAAAEAFERRTSFNIIDQASSRKADLILASDRPFSRAELGRRLTGRVLDRDVPLATAEDTIVAKLEWAKAGESERQLRDVARILVVSGETLDREYLAHWIAELDLDDVWERARDLAERDGD